MTCLAATDMPHWRHRRPRVLRAYSSPSPTVALRYLVAVARLRDHCDASRLRPDGDEADDGICCSVDHRGDDLAGPQAPAGQLRQSRHQPVGRVIGLLRHDRPFRSPSVTRARDIRFRGNNPMPMVSAAGKPPGRPSDRSSCAWLWKIGGRDATPEAEVLASESSQRTFFRRGPLPLFVCLGYHRRIRWRSFFRMRGVMALADSRAPR